jgi:RNA polymerase sigma factor (sigma-70 family)
MYIPFRAATMFRAALPSTRARSQKKPVQCSESGEGRMEGEEPDQIPDPESDRERSEAIDEKFRLLYQELFQIAGKITPNTGYISPGTLVNESYKRVKKSKSNKLHLDDEIEFRCFAVRVMRCVLRDLNRKQGRFVTLVDAADPSTEPVDAIDLERALSALRKSNPAQAEALILQFYGGLTLRQIAKVMNIGLTAVKDYIRFAKAFVRDWICKNPGSAAGPASCE